MKKMIRIALALVLALSLSMSAALAETVVSDTFKLLDEVTIKVEEPTETSPVEEAPTEEAPTEEAPTEEAPTEEAPTEETPTEEAPTEEAPTEETPTEEAPTEEAPTEEVPAEEAPTEESPVGGLPTEQPAAPERSVSIAVDKALDSLVIGDQVTFTAVLSGYEGAQVQIIWQRQVNGEWQSTGETGETLTIQITEENAQSSWRCGVEVLAEASETEAQPVAEVAAQ